MNLKELKLLIPTHTPGYFATVDEQNNPDVRGWQFQVIEDDKIYFFTSCHKNVWEQIQNNPSIAFICDANGYTFRIYGNATTITDSNTIKRLHDSADEGVKAVYPTHDSNGFTVFCLEHGRVSYAKGFVPFTTFEF
ncbi:pyridoxamine 5'-phosphate oxidase family protein [Clostridioides mangenotii]|uniref:pyridoxamine 5'-phosphate oxidase family protein n=1 Tax=Metaclostridioides mangenotii TaxID=1540 RepID=UPI00214A3F63|nr:pyridoxamine 5'-phosphate oxidase family protein [Clostridioides mangenotii]MCR1954579.1 pyridoxamine 5'-phosphate oxidase family protein [Clostridioides mangenotii]